MFMIGLESPLWAITLHGEPACKAKRGNMKLSWRVGWTALFMQVCTDPNPSNCPCSRGVFEPLSTPHRRPQPDQQHFSQVKQATFTIYASKHLTYTDKLEATYTLVKTIIMTSSTTELSQPWKAWYQARPACNPLAKAISLARDSQGAMPQKARGVDLSKPKGQQLSQAKPQLA